MTRARVKDVRKNIPLTIKLAVALRQLGFAKGERVDFDYDPALALRPRDTTACTAMATKVIYISRKDRAAPNGQSLAALN